VIFSLGDEGQQLATGYAGHDFQYEFHLRATTTCSGALLKTSRPHRPQRRCSPGLARLHVTQFLSDRRQLAFRSSSSPFLIVIGFSRSAAMAASLAACARKFLLRILGRKLTRLKVGTIKETPTQMQIA